jgi:hypothetical protein
MMMNLDDWIDGQPVDQWTRKAISKLVEGANDPRDHVQRIAHQLCIADLLEVGWDEWTLWTADEIVANVRAVANEFTEEVVNDTIAGIELDIMLFDMVENHDDEVNVGRAIEALRTGMLEMMEVAESYIVLHNMLVEFWDLPD